MKSPTKIVCVGRNYALHAAELGNSVPSEPLLFLKPPSSLCGDGDRIRLPEDVGRVDFEGEIGLIIGRRVSGASKSEAWGCVSGIVAANDVTARDLQRKDSQWTRAKGMDTFCPVGNPVHPEGVDPASIEVVVAVNGGERQRGKSADMVFDFDELVCVISRLMTLERGDLILTGTPAGVGPLQPGDSVTVSLSCGSSVTNSVRASSSVLGAGGPE